MADDIKVVGQSLEGNKGSVTLSIPVDQLRDQFGVGDKELAVGGLVQRDLGTRYGLRTDNAQTINIPSGRSEMINLARDLYSTEPVVATVIDLMVDLMSTGMENKCEDEKVKEYFDYVCKYGNFDTLHKNIFLEYFLASDIFLMRGPKQVIKGGIDQGMEYYTYSVLNPLFVEVSGPLIFGSEQIGIKPNQELKKIIEDKNNSKIIKQLPPELVKAVKKGELYYPKQEFVSRISRKRLPYDRYAIPFLSRVFEPVLVKRRMREADVAVAETVRTVLVTITTGNDEFPAKPSDLEKLAALFKNPSKSMELFWNHTIEVKYHYPDATLFGDEKYNQVNADIMQGLGIPPVLIDGGGGTFATAWTSLLSVMEKLDAVRREVARWQENEYRRLVEFENLPFKTVPSVEFKPLNLRDEKSWRAMLLELYDRGLLSMDTILQMTDMDILVEARAREMEQSSGVEEILIPRGKPSNTGGRPLTTVQDGDYPDERDSTTKRTEPTKKPDQNKPPT